MNLKVTHATVQELLAMLHRGEWQIPKFQREFIWTRKQVYELLESIFKARPIGLITTWGQPQGNPMTLSEPVKLKVSEFKGYENSPAVIKLVLDGRQRLTALTMAFGGLRDPDDRYQYSGRWFINLDKSPGEDQWIVYKKKREIDRENLSSMPMYLQRALLPLDDHANFGKHNQSINNPELYPEGKFPDSETREARSARLNGLLETFLRFQVPVAELPDSVSLAEVCEIFDVLNQTGTKVSTFDLVHNMLFSETEGAFQLRERFRDYQELQAFGFLCDDDRPELFCQCVTGAFMTEAEPKGRSGEMIRSIKGSDLLNTTTTFYVDEFDEAIQKLDTYASDLFQSVVDAPFKVSDLPYPVSVMLYMALRWCQERSTTDQYRTGELNAVFRAYYWRNALSGRYDQGFLTKFATDLKHLRDLLNECAAKRGTKDWARIANERLESLFGSLYPVVTEDRLREVICDGDLRGAARQALAVYVLGRVDRDLVSGEALDRFSENRRMKVELHHIYPQAWCKDNREDHSVLKSSESVHNAIANLIPLTAHSNNKWKSKKPSTAIAEFNLTFENRSEVLKAAGISESAFDQLKGAKDDPGAVWTMRAAELASALFKLQTIVG